MFEVTARRRYHEGVTPESGEGLGHGVHVSPGIDGELNVVSPRLDLGWRAPEGQVPGTAVMWRDVAFEVVGRRAAGTGACWTLRSWSEASAMRDVFKLDRESVQQLADQAAAEVSNRRARGWAVVMLPVLGLAPAALQKKWANEWGFAADRATMVSAVVEMLAGAVGTIQIAVAAFGGDLFMPLAVAFPGPILFVFGGARLAMVFGDGEPVGSPLGAPFLLALKTVAPEAERSTPAVRNLDDENGVLVLVSPILRRDWDRDGLLRYRGHLFRLDTVGHEGPSWVYRFLRVSPRGTKEPSLSLKPPVSAALEDRHVESPPSFLRTMLMTAAMTLAPASDQHRWAEELGTRAIWLTLLGGSAELVGGFVNLQSDLGSQPSLLALLDFYLVGEGLLRLGSALTGRPMGSVFGWILRPLYRKHLPPETENP